MSASAWIQARRAVYCSRPYGLRYARCTCAPDPACLPACPRPRRCTKKCSKASIFAFEPAIYDPLTNQWSAKGSLAQAMRPRGYHATAILLPTCQVWSRGVRERSGGSWRKGEGGWESGGHNCPPLPPLPAAPTRVPQVLVSGSDTTNDYTAELFSPPYLSKGPRPAMTAVPDVMTPGAVLTVRYTSKDPVDKAILIRAGAVTHSQAFDAHALWLRVLSNAGGVVKLETPANRNVIPPGMCAGDGCGQGKQRQLRRGRGGGTGHRWRRRRRLLSSGAAPATNHLRICPTLRRYMLVLLTNKGVPSNGQILSSY